MSEKWVKHAASPGAHEHYKRAKGNAKGDRCKLFFRNPIIILMKFKGNNTLIEESSEHWVFEYSNFHIIDISLKPWRCSKPSGNG